MELLVGALRDEGVAVRPFSIRAVLRGEGQVVHVHWPESSLAIPDARRATARVGRFLMALLVARLRGMPVIWTAHNLRSHEHPHPRLERTFWRTFPRLLSGWISLTEAGVAQVEAAAPVLARRPHWVTPHGHYRDAYPAPPSAAAARAACGIAADARVLVHVGHLRAYKNAPALVSAYRESRVATRLVVAGSCHPPELEQAIRAAAGEDGSVDLRLQRVPDEQLVALLAAADVVVLPYRETFNSGTALLALSTERPVLLPRTPAYEELQTLVGPGWVFFFNRALTPDDLDQTLELVAGTAPLRRSPALGERFGWSTIAAATVRAYREALGEA